MKKKLIYYILPLIVFIGCSEEFTQVPAIGALSDEALQNEQGVDLLLTGAYSVLDGKRISQGGADWTVTGDNWWFDVLSDDAHKGSTDGDQADLFLAEIYDWTSGNPYFYGKWRGLFAGVNRTNAVISVINKIEGQDFSAKEAEARFLRGHYNFELQKIYGNVPFISVENYDNTEFNQPNPGPIWDEIEADFQFAIENLPDSQEDAGRPNSWTAKAFLGKVLLFQEKFGPALTTLKDVIDNGPYALNNHFFDIFRASGENSMESIFAIQFAADDGLSFNGNLGGTLNFPGGGPFNSCCGFLQPTQDLVNAYQTDANGLPLLDTYNQSDVKNDYGIASSEPFTPDTRPLDPRLDYTVGRRGIDYNGWGVMVGKDWIRASPADISGPYLSKKNIYYAGDDVNMGTGNWGQQRSGINYQVMRFSDVLLMAAEAAVEQNNLDLALEYVNRVRNRAKDSPVVQNAAGTGPAANYKIEPYASFPSQEFARKAVRFERRLELALEAHRLFDLRRQDRAVEVLNAYLRNEARTIPNFGQKAKPYQAKHNLLPIPLTAIDLSGGILTQNPGY
jgi:hypothetical protein